MPKNFMTPNIKEVYFRADNKKVIELSKGEGFSGNDIFGVSEFETAKTLYGLQTTERSKMFYDIKEARKYFNDLKLR